MKRDYRAVVRALRAKAADPAVPATEAEALTAKADQLTAKHGLDERRVNRADEAVREYWSGVFKRNGAYTDTREPHTTPYGDYVNTDASDAPYDDTPYTFVTKVRVTFDDGYIAPEWFWQADYDDRGDGNRRDR